MPATTLTLADFLLARIAEDEACTQGIGSSWHTRLAVNDDDYRARLIKEIAAKRLIVDLHAPKSDENIGRCHHPGCADHHGYRMPPICQECVQSSWQVCNTLAAAASVYADHPDYRDEWKP